MKLPSANGHVTTSSFLHDLIERHASGMYRGYEILSSAAFRVTRNSNLYFQEEEARNLLETVARSCTTAAKAMPCGWRLKTVPTAEIVDRLRVNFELDEWQVFRTDGPVNLSRLMFLLQRDASARPEIPAPSLRARLRLNRTSTDLFDELRHRDILLHHPYDSYDRVVGFIESAAQDPRRGLHQADPLSHQLGFAHVSRPDRGRAEQGSHGRRRADGAL